MGKQKHNLLGQRFSKWTVISSQTRINGKSLWPCRCDCGNERYIAANDLIAEKTKSCARCCKFSRNPKNIYHGLSRTREYGIWLSMKNRCNSPNHVMHKYYGDKGITYCKEWEEFLPFINDMGKCPDGLTLDRIDGDKSYYKENCRWATRKVQQNNRKVTRIFTFNGKTQCMSDWAKEIGICKSALAKRLKKMTIEEALTSPIKTNKRRFNK